LADGEKIRILIVDDIADTRENLAKLIGFEPDMEVAATAGGGQEAVNLAKQHRPHVILMDINMPDMDGITATEIISNTVPESPIIMMSVQGEQDYLRRSMLAGAREFLVKPFSADELINSIRHVHELEKVRRARYAPVAPLDPRSRCRQDAITARSSRSSRRRAAWAARRSPRTWRSPFTR
jgi:pilus assembly protein CpaE